MLARAHGDCGNLHFVKVDSWLPSPMAWFRDHFVKLQISRCNYNHSSNENDSILLIALTTAQFIYGSVCVRLCVWCIFSLPLSLTTLFNLSSRCVFIYFVIIFYLIFRWFGKRERFTYGIFFIRLLFIAVVLNALLLLWLRTIFFIVQLVDIDQFARMIYMYINIYKGNAFSIIDKH